MVDNRGADPSDRLELAARVVGLIAHDLNNLLIPLVGYPDMIRNLLPADSPVMSYIEKIQRSALQIHDANQRLLALSPSNPVLRQEVVLADVIGEELARAAPPASIRVETRIELGRPIQAVRLRVAVAFANLFSNAVDAMPGGGTVRVAVREASLAAPAGSFLGVGPGAYAVLEVSDAGRGIAPAEIPRIFEPFHSTKLRKGGTPRPGLGLSIVFAVAREHGGGIDVEGEPGKGSTFRLYFPVPG